MDNQGVWDYLPYEATDALKKMWEPIAFPPVPTDAVSLIQTSMQKTQIPSTKKE
jgi:hypothetical protein